MLVFRDPRQVGEPAPSETAGSATGSQAKMDHNFQIRDGMRVAFDVPLTMDDGAVMLADLFLPRAEGSYPVLLSYGPYAKGLHFEDGYRSAWDIMIAAKPEVLENTSSLYQSWELVDPEKWVPDGYATVRVDSRGAGRSPGYLDVWSERETIDLYQCIEWAGTQPWSNGKVGLAGISYYAVNQWHVAALQPPHLAAMCVWEGFSDFYRDCARHGGILSTFLANWYDMQVKTVQHGYGARGHRSRVTGELVCGPETLSDEELAANRADLGGEMRSRSWDDAFHKVRTARFDQIRTPLLSAGNWGGNGLHLRGNIEGFVRSASEQKWLEMHGNTHWIEFYADYGVALQKRFFGHFLKGEDTGWHRQPRVLLQVRHPGERFSPRAEGEWPLARTRWTKFYLHPGDRSLGTEPARSSDTVSFDALGEGLEFVSRPLEEDVEITGPSALQLFISSSTADADIFAVLQVLDPDGNEVTFYGALDPHTPIAQGWLRASHRKLDPGLSTFYRPYHTHDVSQPLEPDGVVKLDVEVWPTSIVVPKGYSLALQIRGKDYVHRGPAGGKLSYMKNAFTGCGPFLHDDPVDRDAALFAGVTTLHSGPGEENFILLPIIPPKADG
jgi:uncharacterized protein